MSGTYIGGSTVINVRKQRRLLAHKKWTKEERQHIEGRRKERNERQAQKRRHEANLAAEQAAYLVAKDNPWEIVQPKHNRKA